MGISTEGIQGLRRKCFSHGHTVSGEAEAQLQHRQARAHGVPQNPHVGGVRCFALA